MAMLTTSPPGDRPSPGTRLRPPAIDPARDALFLDIDGTLAPLAPRPEDVGPLARRTRLMERLAEQLNGRVAAVTGRTIADADRILDHSCAVVAGVHGLDIRCPDGATRTAEASRSLQEALEKVRAFSASRPGLLIEDKGPGLTLHYRQTPEMGPEVVAFGRDLAASLGLKGQGGDMVYEVREAGGDKGLAVRTLMALDPFEGARPVFVGDDVTDEDGIRAAQAMGGYGVLVGGRAGSDADYGLADVEAVLSWLETIR